MYKILKSLAVTLMLVAGANASATVISDFVNIREDNNGYVLLSAGDSYTITHDLTDNGVPDLYQVEAAWLSIGLADDNYIRWSGDQRNEREFALITGEGVNSGKVEVDGNIITYDYQFLNVGNSGIDALNNFGLLEITITSLGGDFYWKNSELFAYITPVNVGEPKTLVLLAIGVLGLGLARRRKEI